QQGEAADVTDRVLVPLDPAEGTLGETTRLLGRMAPGDQRLDLHVEMEAKLLVQLLLEPCAAGGTDEPLQPAGGRGHGASSAASRIEWTAALKASQLRVSVSSCFLPCALRR